MPDTIQLTICRDIDVSALSLRDHREAVIDSSERADFFKDLLDLTPERRSQFADYLSIQVTINADSWASWLEGYEVVDVDPEYVTAYLTK